jgi:hypothetical protein
LDNDIDDIITMDTMTIKKRNIVYVSPTSETKSGIDNDTDSVGSDLEDFLDNVPASLPAPKTIGEFTYQIMFIPFFTGIAQGLGSAFASWFLARFMGWYRGLRTEKPLIEGKPLQ